MHRSTMFRSVATAHRRLLASSEHYLSQRQRSMSTFFSRREKEAERKLLQVLKGDKEIELSQLSCLLVWERGIPTARFLEFKDKFNMKIKNWLRLRPHIVEVETGRNERNEVIYYARLAKDADSTTHLQPGEIDGQNEERQNMVDLNSLKVLDLQEKARGYNLKPGKRRKPELIELIRNHEQEMTMITSADNHLNGEAKADVTSEIDSDTEEDDDDEAEEYSFMDIYDKQKEEIIEMLEEADVPFDASSDHAKLAKLLHKTLNPGMAEEGSSSSEANGQSSRTNNSQEPPPNKNGQEFTKNQLVYRDALYYSDIPIVVVNGPAGTGKTTIACEWAANALQNGYVKRLVVTRPSVSAGEDLGYLPGTLEGKLKPYLLPIYDSLADEGIPRRDLERMMKNGDIEVAPISFLRGRTFRNSVIVADEMQNATMDQMKMLLTRLGGGSRMVVTGDLQQSDLGRNVTSGLGDIVNRVGQQPDSQTHLKVIHVEKQDVKRHPAVSTVLSLYDSLVEKSWDDQQNGSNEEEIAADSDISASIPQETSATDITANNDDNQEQLAGAGSIGEVDSAEKNTEYKAIFEHMDSNSNDGDEDVIGDGSQNPSMLDDDKGEDNEDSATSEMSLVGDQASAA